MTLSTGKTNNICCVYFEAKRDGQRDVSGFFRNYKFCATIYDKKSKMGINGGPVIALTVWQMSKKVKRISNTINYFREEEKMSYLRGWNMQPHNKRETEALAAILYGLKGCDR